MTPHQIIAELVALREDKPKIGCAEYDQREAALDAAARAFLAEPEAQPDVLCDKIEQVLLHHRLSNWCSDEDGECPLPLVDRLCDEDAKDISSGKHAIRLICDEIYNQVLKDTP